MTVDVNCPCRKKNVNVMAACDECRKYHEKSNWQRPVACEKIGGE